MMVRKYVPGIGWTIDTKSSYFSIYKDNSEVFFDNEAANTASMGTPKEYAKALPGHDYGIEYVERFSK